MADDEFSNRLLQIPLAAGSEPSLTKKKRNLPGTPDPEAEVIALSPKTLMATNRFVCEICGKGFQREQNLQLHRRGHNLPWKLKQGSGRKEGVVRKRVYVCPEKSCVHNNPSRALGDLTGIKKHFCRKHGEKKWKCPKCSKRYAVHSDWKAHSKTCGTKEYKCDCGTLFSRRDSFITHRAFCDALAEETARVNNKAATTTSNLNLNIYNSNSNFNTELLQTQLFPPILISNQQQQQPIISCDAFLNSFPTPATPDYNNNNLNWALHHQNQQPFHQFHHPINLSHVSSTSPTSLLQKAAQFGPNSSSSDDDGFVFPYYYYSDSPIQIIPTLDTDFGYSSKRRRTLQTGTTGVELGGGQTRDFLGVATNPIISHSSSIINNGWI